MLNECRKDYYQEGSHVYEKLNVLEAFRKAITTWARWVDKNINPMKSIVFFRGYSASHFRYKKQQTNNLLTFAHIETNNQT